MTATAQRIGRTSLDGWMAERLAIPEQCLTRNTIARYQLHALQETLAWARSRSPYYARVLASLPGASTSSLEEFSCLPFTTAEDLRSHAPEFLCLSQDKISRIVTLRSSGTTGTPKRVFFTAEDQERALDFFAHGVMGIASPDEQMLIALPGEREGSVGAQLAKGIARAGIIPIPHGVITDPVRTLQRMDEERATSIIGLPAQVLSLARHPSALAEKVFRQLRSMVLCSDHVSHSIMRALRQKSDAPIFQHYGSTEMGLGGGVDCSAHTGYHMRDADLYFEIIAPENGRSLPEEEFGEVVFTTLARTGMPLIRYRTGDISRILHVPCPCGSPITRLDRIRERVGASIPVGDQGSISIAILDETLFEIPKLIDFTASFIKGTPDHLNVSVYGYTVARLEGDVRESLLAIPAIAAGCAAEKLRLNVYLCHEPFPVTGAKRTIEVRKEQ